MEDFQFEALAPEERIAKQRELKQRGFYVWDFPNAISMRAEVPNVLVITGK